jgi:dihydrofolate reductase
MRDVVLIAALAANGVIGKGGQLPFHLPADLARVKQLTLGKTIIMGRKTYESIPAKWRPLPGRKSIVLTRQRGYAPHPDVQVVHAIEELPAGELWSFGGAEIYALLLPYATRLELTEVHAEVEGDTFFPPYDKAQWQEVARIHNPPTETTPAFDFITYLRK